MTRPLTPENLREAASVIDTMQKMVVKILKAYQMELRRTEGGVRLNEEEAILLEWLTGTEVQDDLRAWAEEVETKR